MPQTKAPHLQADDNIRTLMGDMLIVSVVFLLAAVFYHGFRALALAVVSVLACLLSEWLFFRLRGRKWEKVDPGTVITGLFIAFCLPASVPFWIPVVGAVFATIAVKQLFGGTGKNRFNPSAAAICLLMLIWPRDTGTFPQALERLPLFSGRLESGQAVLQALQSGAAPNNTPLELFFGNHPDFSGTGCILLLLLGGAYLFHRRAIPWQIPAAFSGVVALAAFLFPRGPFGRMDSVFYELFSGAVLFAALFMATDPVTSPATGLGQLFYGAGGGLLTVLFRRLGLFPEGAFLAVLLMNLFVWPLDLAAWRLKTHANGPRLFNFKWKKTVKST